MFKELFRNKRKYATIPSKKAKQDIPEGIMQKCPNCGTITTTKELEKSLKVCKSCNYHYTLSAFERIEMLVDKGRFFEFDTHIRSVDPLSFPNYPDKLKGDIEKTKLNEAIVTGEATIGGFPTILGVMDARFRMGSMGSVVGEKIARAIEQALTKKYPFILFSASGGARMQEGVLSLMQMAKTSAALEKLNQEGILFISILTNPTTGGVAASFSSLGDINLAEPGALIGFAGRRVVEQTVKQKLPDDFQTAEFLFKHGQLDRIVPRDQLRKTIVQILDLHVHGRRQSLHE